MLTIVIDGSCLPGDSQKNEQDQGVDEVAPALHGEHQDDGLPTLRLELLTRLRPLVC